MKNLFIAPLCLVCLFASCQQSANKIYHYEEYGLNSPVKSVKVTTYEAESKFGDIVKGELEWNGHYLVKFNAVGNIESIQEFDDDGDLTGVVKYKYNELNNVIGFYDYDEEGECKYSSVCEYDGMYLVKQTITNYYSNEPEITVLEFVRTGEWITETRVTKDKELSSLTKYSKSDATGGEWITYDKTGKELSKGVQKLNKNGRIIEHCEYDICHKIEWNDKNLPVHLTNALLHHNTIVSWYMQDESPECHIEYEYDDKDNWIRQIVFECDGELKVPVTISEREIIY